MTPLKLGIAGANAARGWARDTHIPALAALPQITIHAVSARDQTIADEAAAAFGAAKAYGDTLAMVRDADIDIVAVLVKVPEHRAIVLAALAAGKHVYCEWPLGRDLAEAKEMAAAAKLAHAHVAIGLQGANSLAVRHAAKLLADGVIGQVLNLRVVSSTAGWGTLAPPHYAYLQDKTNGATLATIAGGHTLAMVEAVVGGYAQVSARNSILQSHVEIAGTGEKVARSCADHMLITGLHHGGCVSSVEILGGSPIPLQFELRGTKGVLRISGAHPGGYQCAELHVTCESELGLPPQPLAPQPQSSFPGLKDAPVNVAQMWAQFADDISRGISTMPNFEDAVRLTQLLDAIELSSDAQRCVNLEP